MLRNNFNEHPKRGIIRGVKVKVLDCNLKVNEFELQSSYYVHFLTDTIGKGTNPLIPPRAPMVLLAS